MIMTYIVKQMIQFQSLYMILFLSCRQKLMEASWVIAEFKVNELKTILLFRIICGRLFGA